MAYFTNVTPSLERVLETGNTSAGTDLALDSGSVIQADNSLIIDAATSVETSRPVIVDSSMYCTGNTYIAGSVTSVGANVVNVGDNVVLLNASNTSGSASPANIVGINSATNTTTSTEFVAGVASVSHPYITVASVTGFSAGCFVLVNNPNGIGVNNGLYECQGVSGSNLNLKSTSAGLTSRVEDFTKDQLTTESSTDYNVSVVNVSVMKTSSSVWKHGTGSSTPLTLVNLGSGSPLTYFEYQLGSHSASASPHTDPFTGSASIGTLTGFTLSSGTFTATQNMNVIVTAKVALLGSTFTAGSDITCSIYYNSASYASRTMSGIDNFSLGGSTTYFTMSYPIAISTSDTVSLRIVSTDTSYTISTSKISFLILD